jgi:phosphatidylserine/phosphatidylglycerophosphate/cardiolipin synthase-like enzyme
MEHVNAQTLDVTTLSDGGQRAEEIAARLVAFLGAAQRSLDIALYDVRLPGAVGDDVREALESAVERGVIVRLLYNVPGVWKVPVPPPPSTRPELLETLSCAVRGIAGQPDLMHHKYVVRDAEAVWTGSANWTIDSWTRQENVLCTAESVPLARAFQQDFAQLWSSNRVEGSGRFDTVADEGVRPWFTPGRGRQLSQRIATAMGEARERIRIASPVITAGPILGTLAEVASEGRVDLAGVVDATQVGQVVRQWRENGNATWKLPSLERVMADDRVHGKQSVPWGPGTLHDFMHAKVTVCDDTVFLGSFNLSRSGEENAENVLEIESGELADRLATWIDGIRARYPDVVIAPAGAAHPPARPASGAAPDPPGGSPPARA